MCINYEYLSHWAHTKKTSTHSISNQLSGITKDRIYLHVVEKYGAFCKLNGSYVAIVYRFNNRIKKQNILHRFDSGQYLSRLNQLLFKALKYIAAYTHGN